MEQRIIAPDAAQGLLDGTTPGPWNDTRVKWSGNGSARSHEHQLCNAQGVGVAIVTHDGSAEALANDRLHAAAPDLARSVIEQHLEFDRITDQAAAKIGESEADLSSARGEIARLRAALAEAHAIIEGRTTPPTDAEIAAHWRAGGTWIVEGVIVLRDVEAVCAHRDQASWAAVTWLPINRARRPCEWPTVTP